MIIWFVICFILYSLSQRKLSSRVFFLVAGYYLIVFILSSVSLHFFPVQSDEQLYTSCAREISNYISLDFLSNLWTARCSLHPGNFVRWIGLVGFIGRGDADAIIGYNAFSVFWACWLLAQTFLISDSMKKRIFQVSLFFPPILYLAVRPSKEASIALVISLLCYALSIVKWPKKFALILISIGLYYLIRWQHGLAGILNLLMLGPWILLRSFKNMQRVAILVAFIFVSLVAWITYRDVAIRYLNQTYFKSDIIQERSSDQGSALIYRLMLKGPNDNSFNEWNLIIAHVGGFFTPHPLRFLREARKVGHISYHIFEEFLLVSFWFYLLLPVFGIYLKNTFLKNIRRIEEIPLIEVFKLTFVSTLFSMSCLTILYHTPQSFRYKVPLNVYLFMTIGMVLATQGPRTVFNELRKSKWTWCYVLGLLSYSVVYLII